MELTYQRMTSEEDCHIPLLASIYALPQVKSCLGLGEQYFHYVTHWEHVSYYKVFHREELIGTLHLEREGTLLSLAILVFPAHQREGFGSSMLRDVQRGSLGSDFKVIEAFIDEGNIPSIRLFERSGFLPTGAEDGLLHYVWSCPGD